MFEARVYNIMIGAPSDIKEEIVKAKEVFHKWNCINSISYNIILNMLYWESSTYPCLMQAQNSINEQIVNKSDLMICVFGTKLGTPVNGFPSGTAEEIERHRLRGKNVMVFFRRENDMGDVDMEKFSALLNFKKSISDKVYYAEYNNINDFESILLCKLQLFINDKWRISKEETGIYINQKSNIYINDLSSFFNLFGEDGISYKCVAALMVKYDLAQLKGFYKENLKKEDKTYFYDVLPKRIMENRSALLNIDFDSIFREVDGNIKQYTTIENKEDYAMGLLRPFANYLKIVRPVFPETLSQRADEIKKRFLSILKGKYPQNSVESIYKIVWECLDRYTDLLEYTLAHNGISLFVLQDKTGIYLTDRIRHIAHRYIQWTSDIDAKRISDELNSKYKL